MTTFKRKKSFEQKAAEAPVKLKVRKRKTKPLPPPKLTFFQKIRLFLLKFVKK